MFLINVSNLLAIYIYIYLYILFDDITHHASNWKAISTMLFSWPAKSSERKLPETGNIINVLGL